MPKVEFITVKDVAKYLNKDIRVSSRRYSNLLLKCKEAVKKVLDDAKKYYDEYE